MRYKTFDPDTYLEILTGFQYSKELGLSIFRGYCILADGSGEYSLFHLYQIIYN